MTTQHLEHLQLPRWPCSQQRREPGGPGRNPEGPGLAPFLRAPRLWLLERGPASLATTVPTLMASGQEHIITELGLKLCPTHPLPLPGARSEMVTTERAGGTVAGWGIFTQGP